MKQLPLPIKGRGGWRPGAGRPRREKKRNVMHRRRESLSERHPLHVTWRIRDELGSMRTRERFRAVQSAFRYGHDRFGMRLTEFSVQGNHVHLIVEAKDRRALTRGLQGLAIRVARALNRVLGRAGKVFGDRYHARALKTLNEVKNAVEYVLKNGNRHLRSHPWWIDPFSSMSGEAVWTELEMIIARPRTWLLKRVLSR